MSLEEEVVFQRMNQGSDAKDMTAFIEALESTGLKIDRTKVNTSISRYFLLQKANSVSKSEREKRINDRFEFTCKKYMEKFMEDPSIISVSLSKEYKGGARGCDCGGTIRVWGIDYIQIKKEGVAIYTKVKDGKWSVFGYCFNCGKVEDSPKYVDSGFD